MQLPTEAFRIVRSWGTIPARYSLPKSLATWCHFLSYFTYTTHYTLFYIYPCNSQVFHVVDHGRNYHLKLFLVSSIEKFLSNTGKTVSYIRNPTLNVVWYALMISFPPPCVYQLMLEIIPLVFGACNSMITCLSVVILFFFSVWFIASGIVEYFSVLVPFYMYYVTSHRFIEMVCCWECSAFLNRYVLWS